MQINVQKKSQKTSSSHDNLYIIGHSKYEDYFFNKPSLIYFISLLINSNKPIIDRTID